MNSAQRNQLRPRRSPTFLRLRYRKAEQFLVSYCTNISRGGMFVKTNQPLEPGTRLEASLDIPGIPTPTVLHAEVRWVRPQGDSFGPAGMGLGFEGIDDSLGEAIDHIVELARPLAIDIVGPNDLGSRHLAALVQALVACKVRHHELRASTASRVQNGDLVIVDLDAYGERALALLELLHQSNPGHSMLALATTKDRDLHQRASSFARVVGTPVDPNDFQSRVLEALCDVQVVPSEDAEKVKER
jgi:uncharacterized protein (TIGR02266 family)